jgi:S-adenosylhomocysteine hydrolase
VTFRARHATRCEFPDGHRIILLSEGRLVNLGNAMGQALNAAISGLQNAGQLAGVLSLTAAVRFLR